MFYYDIWQ
jgi:hypothetical protein